MEVVESIEWVTRYAERMRRSDHITSLLIIAIASCTTSFAFPFQKGPDQERPAQGVHPGIDRPLLADREMSGWKVVGGDASFEWVDSMIHGFRPGSRNTFLMSERQYGDFILEGEIKIDSGNSGWQIRSHLYEPIGRKSRLYGYQVEVDPSERSWSGGLYDEGRRGWIHSLAEDQSARNAFKAGAWNHYRIEAIGPHIRTWVNGTPCADVIDMADLSGSIALQVHSGECEVWWRKLKITELGTSRYENADQWVLLREVKREAIRDHDRSNDSEGNVHELREGDRAQSDHPMGARGISLRVRYQMDGTSILQLKNSEDGKTILEVPLGRDEEIPDESSSTLPVVAPGAGLMDLGDEWREFIIDLESNRLVVIDEGRVRGRKQEVDLDGLGDLRVLISCGSGSIRLGRINELVHRNDLVPGGG